MFYSDMYYILLFLLPPSLCVSPPAEEIASSVVPAVISAMKNSSWLHYRNYGSWSYEGGVITRGLWELSHTFQDSNLETFLHQHLNYFIEDPHEFGFRILHNESLTYNGTSMFLPWLYSIGDNIGLFPIVYGDRHSYATMSDLYSQEQDLYILSEVVDKYIYGYPWHLPDGTISRPITWLSEGFLEPHGTGVWVDDMFMGTAVLVEWAKITGDVEYLEYACWQLKRITEYLYREEHEDGLLHHGYNFWTGDLSCCKWGRGNGWAFIAMTEVLEAGQKMAAQLDILDHLLLMYRRHASGLLAVQSAEGRWHNILNNNNTFLETSASAMFLTGLARGLRYGWLEEDDDIILDSIERAWSAVAGEVNEDGTIDGIIGGTGIKDTEDDYAPDNTDYSKASPGVGAVLRAVAEIAVLQHNYGLRFRQLNRVIHND